MAVFYGTALYSDLTKSNPVGLDNQTTANSPAHNEVTFREWRTEASGQVVWGGGGASQRKGKTPVHRDKGVVCGRGGAVTVTAQARGSGGPGVSVEAPQG